MIDFALLRLIKFLRHKKVVDGFPLDNIELITVSITDVLTNLSI